MKGAGVAAATPEVASKGCASAGRDAGDLFLQGRVVLVTRPDGQAETLVRAIAAAGGEALRFPTLDIDALTPGAALDRALRRLALFDLVVFVSPNAVLQAQARCAALGLPGLSAVRRAAAPGTGTAAALSALGVAEVLVPAQRFDSEGLIEVLTARAIAPASVLILRGTALSGEGATGSGRDLLAHWLLQRGATVETVACYRRQRVAVAPERIAALLARPAVDAIVVSSSEGGAGLVELLGGAGLSWLAGTVIFVPHWRIAERMRAFGLGNVNVTAGGDDGIMLGLADYFRTPGK